MPSRQVMAKETLRSQLKVLPQWSQGLDGNTRQVETWPVEPYTLNPLVLAAELVLVELQVALVDRKLSESFREVLGKLSGSFREALGKLSGGWTNHRPTFEQNLKMAQGAQPKALRGRRRTGTQAPSQGVVNFLRNVSDKCSKSCTFSWVSAEIGKGPEACSQA